MGDGLVPTRNVFLPKYALTILLAKQKFHQNVGHQQFNQKGGWQWRLLPVKMMPGLMSPWSCVVVEFGLWQFFLNFVCLIHC